MKAMLREITYSDKSKKKILVINNNESAGSIKITAKQWKVLKGLGLEDDKITIPSN